MLINILILLALIAFTVVAGWVTWRAIRAKRTWVKIVGVLGAGLLTLVLAAVTVFTGKGLAFMYIPPAPAPDLTVEGTPEQIARGRYLAGVACVGCHGANESGEFPLTGGSDFAAEIPIPIGSMIVANLTPAGILADRTDGELFRAIRQGYGKHARAGMMTFEPWRLLSDEDIEAIIAFLRSQDPVTTAAKGGDSINILGALLLYGLGLQPLPDTPKGVITTPPKTAGVEYGKYVATFGGCRGCHGPNLTGEPATMFVPAFPNPRPYVGTLTAEQFIAMMRTGVRPNGVPLAPPMAWKNAAAMSDDDLVALYTYLKAAP
jgi:mono/diheme cytochrome c family protein